MKVGNGPALLIVFIAAWFNSFAQDLPVFPGAEGFGSRTPAGRGGEIITVTNLNPEGPGSLKEACESSGPRIVVFEVGGVIDLRPLNDNLPIAIRNPYITIAGQTAPSPGITIIGYGIRIATHDVWISHLAIRQGDFEGARGSTRQCFYIDGSENNHAADIFINNCSLTWSVNKMVSTWTNGDDYTHDITFLNCTFCEGLHCAGIHPEGCHSKGFLLGDYTIKISLIGNLFSHNVDRNPACKGRSRSVLVNNLIYNPGGVAIVGTMSTYYGGGMRSIRMSAVGNVLKPGRDTQLFSDVFIDLGGVGGSSRVYEHDNVDLSERYPATNVNSEWRYDDPDSVLWTSPLTVLHSSQTYEYVLNNAGYRPAERDYIDERIINDVRNSTGRIINHISEVGGFPDFDETRRELNIPDNPDGDEDGDGYTNVEAWLHDMARAVEGTGRPDPLEVSDMSVRVDECSTRGVLYCCRGKIELRFPSEVSIRRVDLFSADGTVCLTRKKLPGNTVPVPQKVVRSGVYFIKVWLSDSDNVISSRILLPG
ncbi:MAG: hypothetical protein GF350_09485 [Chitinivibrionales bacterium]|nr:hypothetical protein [Chitinivibrionales bacterium]